MAGLTKAEKRNQRDHYFRHQRGNKCMKCGYSKSPRALHWHHVWPKDKSFGVNKARMDWGLEKLQEEIDKCVLLCGNCHMELHDGFWDLTPGEKAAYKEQVNVAKQHQPRPLPGDHEPYDAGPPLHSGSS